ncbi:septum site-determining protein Ssd [Nocardia amikacinitolerans]|uniref:septum site-determining protein Ssd n=1 Tax=Nocardia amikacinitolerans TaxID=756689 RepID=UPI0020A50EA9|nr:septum site-determining protein Ssd [Nocardia amikacinitolerans]MCP2278217.1 helicase/secretion neighborhood CpaE-like protein [Nocardia amikacinitolerans]
MDTDAAQTARSSPALVLIRDVRLRDEVRRVAAAAERPLDEREPPVGRHVWSGTPLVILDTAGARSCAAAGCARRAGVVLVTDGEPELSDWQAAAAVGAERVIALPASAEGLVEKFAEHGERRASDGIAVAFASGSGGAGASVLAAATALRAAAEGFRRDVLLVDGAPFGGGLDLLLGIEKATGPRWPDLVVEDGRVAAAALHSALPRAAPGLGVLSCGRGGAGRLPGRIGAGAVRAVIEAGRAAGDLVICDISGVRGAHAEQMLDRADLVVLVVQATLRAVAAAESVAAFIGRRNPNQGLVVRGPAPGGLRGAEVAEVLDLPLLAAVRAQGGLAGRLERGGLATPRRGPLTDAADAVLAVLGAPTVRSGR